MKGLELSKKYYLTCAKDIFEQELGEAFNRLAIGLAGEGSECFGFDDELSTDHDFEPAFCLWLTKEDYEKFGFKLEKLYAKLPKEFEGFSAQKLSAVGGNRHGVMTIGDFYLKFLGTPTAPQSLEQWLYLPSSALACACNGDVFYDGLGEFSAIRQELSKGYPTDVRLKKLGACCAFMAQAGLYNYGRCVARGERGAAQLAIFEFVKHAVSAIYLLNNAYEPFYKWAYKGMRSFKVLSELETSLVALTELGNTEIEAKAKQESIEQICTVIAEEIKRQGLCDGGAVGIEACAYSLQNSIRDVKLRNMHIMDGI